jgi:hypothetical protein
MTRAHLAYAAKQIRHFRVTYERSYSYGLGVGRLRGGHRELSCQILVGVVDSLCSGVLGRRDTTVADFVEKAESLARQIGDAFQRWARVLQVAATKPGLARSDRQEILDP